MQVMILLSHLVDKIKTIFPPERYSTTNEPVSP